MRTKIRLLSTDDYVIGKWEGGSTTQIAIAPENSVYADRDFLWRFSSATVDLDESLFTPLPDYHRLIAPVTGEMTLVHDDCDPVCLKTYQIHAFDGEVVTKSRGRCVDFNLMLRKGRCTGDIWCLHSTGDEAITILSGCGRVEPAAVTTLLLHCLQGSAVVPYREENLFLPSGYTLLAEFPPADLSLACAANACFIAAGVRDELDV